MTGRILIVDDHEAIRGLIDTILTHAGYDCMTASTGDTALEMARRFKFDLVVLDVNMPRMSGLELLPRIRVFIPRALMVTADSSIDTVREAMALGCHGYIAKPIDPGVLISRVGKLMQTGAGTA